MLFFLNPKLDIMSGRLFLSLFLFTFVAKVIENLLIQQIVISLIQLHLYTPRELESSNNVSDIRKEVQNVSSA